MIWGSCNVGTKLIYVTIRRLIIEIDLHNDILISHVVDKKGKLWKKLMPN